MRNKIITAGSGLFLAFGSVGGFEQGTMNLGQAVVLGIIGCMLMFVGIGGEEDGDKQRTSSKRKRRNRSNAA